MALLLTFVGISWEILCWILFSPLCIQNRIPDTNTRRGSYTAHCICAQHQWLVWVASHVSVMRRIHGCIVYIHYAECLYLWHSQLAHTQKHPKYSSSPQLLKICLSPVPLIRIGSWNWQEDCSMKHRDNSWMILDQTKPWYILKIIGTKFTSLIITSQHICTLFIIQYPNDHSYWFSPPDWQLFGLYTHLFIPLW